MKIHCYCFLTCLTIHVLWRHVNFLSSICLALSLLCRHIVIVFPHLVQKTHWYDFPKRYTTIVFFPHFYIFSDFVYTILFHTYKFSQVFVTKTLFIVSCLLYFPSMLKTLVFLSCRTLPDTKLTFSTCATIHLLWSNNDCFPKRLTLSIHWRKIIIVFRNYLTFQLLFRLCLHKGLTFHFF